MPVLVPSKKFLEDCEKVCAEKTMRKKLGKVLWFLAENPNHPGLRLERMVNDPTAWAVRLDRKYRISYDPESYLASGSPDWSSPLLLLRMLSHDDLYKFPL